MQTALLANYISAVHDENLVLGEQSLLYRELDNLIRFDLKVISTYFVQFSVLSLYRD